MALRERVAYLSTKYDIPWYGWYFTVKMELKRLYCSLTRHVYCRFPTFAPWRHNAVCARCWRKLV